MGIRACLCVVGAAAMLASGCYEKPRAHLYQPGVYKGRTDPLLKLEASTRQQELLRKRFDLVQRDR